MRYLVVAKQTLGGQHLIADQRRLEAGPCSPLRRPGLGPPRSLHLGRGGGARDRRRAARPALERFRRLGAKVDGEVGDPRPLQAIRDVWMLESLDGIIVSTVPPSFSRWPRLDLPNRVAATFDAPVTHLVGQPEATSVARRGG